MKLLGALPKKPCAFTELLDSLLNRPAPWKQRLLRTCFETGYLTDGGFLSRLKGSEQEQVQKLHYDAIATDSTYGEESALSLAAALPKYLSKQVLKARDAGGVEGKRFVYLESGEHKVLVTAKAFLTLKERHPEAIWWLASGSYWKKGVVLLEGPGFYEGAVLGALAPVDVQGNEKLEPLTLRKRKRLPQGKRYSYQRISNQENRS